MRRSAVLGNTGYSPQTSRAGRRLRPWRCLSLRRVGQAQRRRAEDRKQIKELEREVRRKDKALAEATALLVLSKKPEAIFQEGEEG